MSYLRMTAAAVLLTLFMALPVALCIVLDTRMNTPPPVPLPEPPKRVEAPRHAWEPGDEMELVDGPRVIRLRVVRMEEPSARCDCPICREYRDKYPDWESTSHYYKAHKDALKRP